MLFQIHFELVIRKHFHILLDGRCAPFSYSFSRRCIQELKVLCIIFTRSLVQVDTGNRTLSSKEDNFPSLHNFFIWTLERSLSISSPVDVAVVNGKYSPGKLASKAGTGERLTGTPLVQPSL